MADTAERLTELLNLKDTELEQANARIERLERELEGSLDGWRFERELKEDGLPLPRLELVYEQRREWSDYVVSH